MTELQKPQTDDTTSVQGDPEQEIPTETSVPDSETEQDEDKTVRALRDEAARSRIALKEATTIKDGAIEKLRALTLATSGDVLADPLWALEYDPENMDDPDGLPDPEKVRAAAQKLAESRPFLARGPRGNVGQGEHSASVGTPSISELLRQSR